MKVSKHARQRMKERIGLKSASSMRLAKLAFEKGLTREDTTGKLKSYIDKLYLSQKSADEIRIYGRFIYIFVGTKLITVCHLSKEYHKLSEKCLRRKGELNELATNSANDFEDAHITDVSRDREGDAAADPGEDSKPSV